MFYNEDIAVSVNGVESGGFGENGKSPVSGLIKRFLVFN